MNMDEIKGSTVFVVDDNVENLRVLVNYLKKLDLIVVPVRSGEEILELVQKRTPDIILLDIMMPPGIDGYETCTRLKKMDSTRNIPVIFMSALNETVDKVKGFNTGAVDYISKPFETEELYARVKIHILIRRLQIQLQEANSTLENRVRERTKELSLANDALTTQIEERKRIEETLREVNRAYKVLTDFNHALIGNKTEHQLGEDLCRIIVHDGGYRLAWVGIAENDNETVICPVHRNKVKKDNLVNCTSSWWKTQDNNSHTCIANQVPSDPALKCFKQSSSNYGFASFIVLPLLIGNTVAGSLNIYAAEPDAFKGEEVKLLEELADNLSYGINSLRTEREKKQTQQALEVSEKNYQTLFEESKDAIFFSTPSGQILEINNAGVELFGYPCKEELLAVDVTRDLYLRAEDREKYLAHLTKKGYTKDYEFTLKRKDGKKIDVFVTSTVVLDKDGNIQMFRGIIRDVTTHKALEAQLRQAQKMEGIGRLAGGIAHDFNNLLTAIIGYSDLIKKKTPEGSPVDNYIEKVISAGNSARGLVRQILTFIRKDEAKRQPVNIDTVIANFLGMLHQLLGENIALEINSTCGLSTINSDPHQIEQILMNLTVNARDAMPDGGKLTIETANTTLNENDVSIFPGLKPGDYVVLTTTDTGCGMDEETVSHIFEPFFTTKEKGKGTGLGLAMVYGIVKQHKGHIDINSEPGSGTTFKIYFPAN